MIASALGDWLYANGVATVALALAAIGFFTGTVLPRREDNARRQTADLTARWEIYTLPGRARSGRGAAPTRHSRLVVENRGAGLASDVAVTATRMVRKPGQAPEESGTSTWPGEGDSPISLAHGQEHHFSASSARAWGSAIRLRVVLEWTDVRGRQSQPLDLTATDV